MFFSLFYLFIWFILVFLVCLSSSMVLITTNPIYSILYLILTFLFSVCILFYYNMNFMGLILIIIYLGAIAVLFLFVIMMLNIKQIEYNESFSKLYPIGFFIAIIFFSQMIMLFDFNIKNIFIEGSNCDFNYLS